MRVRFVTRDGQLLVNRDELFVGTSGSMTTVDTPGIVVLSGVLQSLEADVCGWLGVIASESVLDGNPSHQMQY